MLTQASPAGPRRPRGIGIAAALVVLLVLVLAPILALAIAYAVSVLRLNGEAIDRGLQGTAHALSLAVDREVQTAEVVLFTLAGSPAVDTQDWPTLYAQAASIARRFSGWIVLTAPSMQQIFNTLRPFGDPLPLSSTPETMRTVLATGAPVVSDLIWGRVSQRSIVAVVVPVMRNGTALYNLDVTLTPDRFGRILSAQGLPQGWTAMLLDRNDAVIATSDALPQEVGNRAAVFAAAANSAEGVVNVTPPGERGYKIAFQRSAETGWKIIVASPMAIAATPTRVWALTLGAGALASLLVACGVALFLGRRIAAPLQALAQQAGAMVRGEPATMPPSPIREVAAVQKALSEATVAQRDWIAARIHLAEERKAREAAEQSRDAIKSREDALSISEERYRGLTEAIASVVFSTNAEGQATDPAGWCSLTGQTPQECVGFGWLDAVHPDDRERALAGWKEALNDRLPYAVELRLRDGSGHYTWYDTRAVPVIEADGGVREWVGVCIDINGRKTAEERQRLLTAELNHRVRNILAAVQAMIGLTAQSAPSQDELARRLQGRVAAMARTHGLLTSEKWRGAGLSRIIRDELEPYVGGNDEAVMMIGGPDCILPPRLALDFAMVVHELATNAAKYGALSVPGGRISVDWRMEGDEADTRLALVWQESGGPPVQPPSRRGFGIRLLENVLGRTPKSSLELRFEPEGVCCRIGMWLAGEGRLSAGSSQPTQTQTQQQQQEAGLVRTASAAPRVLVAEDEPLAALEITGILTEAGLQVVGPAATVREAMELARGAAIVAAILDVNLKGDMIFPVADLLVARGAPVVLVTGYDSDSILPERYRGIGALRKPIDRNLLLDRLSPLLALQPAAKEG
ncbi:MAG: HWE histidine kinase domain-containing protein [Rhodospirillales bacterium]